MRQQTRDSNGVPLTTLQLRGPTELFERLDAWCAQQQQARGMTIKPSRPAAIRYIVHNFLLKEEQRQAPRAKRRGRKAAR